MQNQPPINRPGMPGQVPPQQGTPPQQFPGGGGLPPVNGQVPPAQTEEPKGPPISIEDLHIDELLHIVVDMTASDLHICSASPPVIPPSYVPLTVTVAMR